MKGKRTLYRLKEPCFGFFLQGGTKCLAVVDIGIEVSMLIIQTVATLDPNFISAWTRGKELDLVKFYARPIHWWYYYTYFIANIVLSCKLYEYAAERNKPGLWRHFKISIILYIFWLLFFLSHVFWIRFENKRGLATFIGFSLYKIYSFWLLLCFVREVDFYGELNSDMRRLSDRTIESFFEGVPKIAPDSSHPFVKLPHRKELEVPRSRLKVEYEHPLGIGAFAVVLKGQLIKREGDPFVPNSSVEVAVKTLNVDADIVYYKALLSELKILSYIGRHENIVNLIAACTSELRERKLFVIVEFCPLGSVLNYLRANRGIMQDSKGPSLSGYIGSNMLSAPTTFDLIKWSWQTALGMEYISSKNVIHGDLAARNVLLTADRDVKISDFGLSRQLYHYSIYMKHNDEPLPWRWLSVEALCDLKFSSKSDVWSFGICLWEYYSCGETPYPGISYSVDFLKALRDEENPLRPEKPPYATNEVFKIMQHCWKSEAEDRPTFTDLKIKLGEMYREALL